MSAILFIVIGAQMISLTPAHTTEPTTRLADTANIETWFDGTLIYAHNYLAGAEFDEAETMTVIYTDGSARQFEVTRTIVIDEQDWTTTLLEYSTPETITLATCHTAGMVWMAELTEVHDDDPIRTIPQSR